MLQCRQPYHQEYRSKLQHWNQNHSLLQLPWWQVYHQVCPVYNGQWKHIATGHTLTSSTPIHAEWAVVMIGGLSLTSVTTIVKSSTLWVEQEYLDIAPCPLAPPLPALWVSWDGNSVTVQQMIGSLAVAHPYLNRYASVSSTGTCAIAVHRTIVQTRSEHHMTTLGDSESICRLAGKWVTFDLWITDVN